MDALRGVHSGRRFYGHVSLVNSQTIGHTLNFEFSYFLDASIWTFLHLVLS